MHDFNTAYSNICNMIKNGYFLAKCDRDIDKATYTFRVATLAIERLEGMCKTSDNLSLIHKLWGYLYENDKYLKDYINNYGEL